MNHCDPQTLGEQVDRTTAVAAALAELGVRAGERVLIMLPDCPDFIDAFTGAMRLDAVPLSVNPLLPAADIAAIAAQTGARLVLASAERIHGLAGLQAAPSIRVAGSQGLWVAVLRRR